MKKRLAYIALIILLIFGLYWMNAVMLKGYDETIDSDGWLDQHSEIKVDTTR